MSSEKVESVGNVGYGHGLGFTLIVVLFILLIIVGAAFVGDDEVYGYDRGCY